MEVSNAVTDLVITAVCWSAAALLLRSWPAPRKGWQRWYLAFFLLMGLGTLCGATLSHGFSHIFTAPVFKYPNWLCNIAALSCFGMAVIERSHAVSPLKSRTLLHGLLLLETLGMLAWTFLSYSFLPAKVHIGLCLLALSLPLQLRRWGARESKFILAVTLMMLLIPVVLVLHWSPAPWLDTNDVSHLIIAAAMYVTYMACRESV